MTQINIHFIYKHILLVKILFISFLLQTAFYCASAPVDDPPADITDDAIKSTIYDLAAFGTRYARNPKALEAAAYLEKRLREIGLQTTYDTFQDDAVEMRNVVGVMPSRKGNSSQIIILGAHYDSTSSEAPDGPAPGADDNASGVAAVLAAAEALNKDELNSEIRVVFFTAEEMGCKGSKHYVKETLAAEKRPVVALIADYIGEDTGRADSTMILHNRHSAALMRKIISVAKEEPLELKVSALPSDYYPTYGDYRAFWDAKYQAVMFVREYHFDSDSTNIMHTPNDLPERINIGQVTKVSKLIYYSVLALDSLNY